MGDITGFMKYERQDFEKEPAAARVRHWKEFIASMPQDALRNQGARCMDCGIPFCHWACPVGNLIPEWNDLVFRGEWQAALTRLRATNNFPEITGRVCPAPCEDSCVLAINRPAVTIKNIERMIIEEGYLNGWVRPMPPAVRTGRKIAVIGSGPAGLACADELNKKGHSVTVFEKNEDIGGLLTFGIPDFKLEKQIVQRRIGLMQEEGIKFKTGMHVGVGISTKHIQKEFDVMVLAGGAEEARNLKVPGRELKGVFQAMQYLPQQNRVNKGQSFSREQRIDAHDKHVIILGGGDTGSDCVGTANRQGARSVKQFEILGCPPRERPTDNPWPQWARIYRPSSSHEEGVAQDYGILTKSLSGKDGVLKTLHGVRLEYAPRDPKTGASVCQEVPGSQFSVPCDLLILAMGFLGPVKTGLLADLGLELDPRGNVKTDGNYMTSIPGVFAAGDMRRGQSLVVWAIQEGRAAASGVHAWLARAFF